MKNDISLKLDSLAYISAAVSTGVSSTTFTQYVLKATEYRCIFIQLPWAQTSTGRQCFAFHGSTRWDSWLSSLHDIRSKHILTYNEHHVSGIFVNLMSFTMFKPYLFPSERVAWLRYGTGNEDKYTEVPLVIYTQARESSNGVSLTQLIQADNTLLFVLDQNILCQTQPSSNVVYNLFAFFVISVCTLT